MIFWCRNCGAQVDAVFEHSYDDESDFVPLGTTIALYRCRRCDGPFLMQTLERGETVNKLLYPQLATVDPRLPKPILSALTEAQLSFDARAYTAAAMMCRKTLEAICASHKAEGGDLAQKLQSLRETGVMEQRLWEWADALRIVGNSAAHDLDSVGVDDARDTMEFTYALLEYVFTFRDRFEAFRVRRARGDLPADPAPSSDPTE